MPISSPLYDSGDVVYLKESAALGVLEPVRISGVVRGSAGWMYMVEAKAPLQRAPAVYGDRKSMINNATLYFTENEFVSHCDAIIIAEANAERALNTIRAQKQTICPDITAG